MDSTTARKITKTILRKEAIDTETAKIRLEGNE
jgi:hypothetical protein